MRSSRSVLRSHKLSSPTDRTSLGEVLGADGALDVPDGYSGALNADNFRMRTDSTGQPHFYQTSKPSDANWSGQFGRPGLDIPYVAAVAVSGDKVYG
ncbi:MAG: hypothetical protein BRD45_06060 [Bacteroidetes bacterium QS_8_64_10]|nr:MAG: hypothetical protein BRD45_06060 [Bacteroidetes bacterium QS_8_64_10]